MNWNRREWAAGLAAAALGCTRDPGRAPEPADLDSSRRHVIDLHCDTPMLFRDGSYDIGSRNERGQVDIPRMREGGVTAVFFSIYTSPSRHTELEAVQEAIEIMDAVRRETERFPSDLALARSSEDIETARKAGRIAILMGVEGGHMINSSLAVLRAHFRLGARYMTLTHGKPTPWAGSSGSDGESGLTDFGRQVVAEMNRLGMMVDISHVSDQTFWDALEASQAPLIASHSSARAIASHPRNMTDAMIRATAERGGVVHINYYNAFLDQDYAARSRRWNEENPRQGQDSGNAARLEAKLAAIGRPPLAALLDHFEHAIRVGGVEAVGLGSDFDGVDGELPEGMEDISKLSNLADGLAQRGFGEADIDKILGGNSLRVFQDIEAASESSA